MEDLSLQSKRVSMSLMTDMADMRQTCRPLLGQLVSYLRLYRIPVLVRQATNAINYLQML